ncbi:glycosyltransferase family 4 protein [Porphyromonas sp.]
MKIVYCLFGVYSTGGIERVTTVKANWLAEHGYEVYLVTTGHAGHPPYYPLHPSIKHIDLGLCYEVQGAISRFEAFRRNLPKHCKHKELLEELFAEIRPDIAVAAGWHEGEFLYQIKDGSKKIIEHHIWRNANFALHSLYLKQMSHVTLLRRVKSGLLMLWNRWLTYKQGRYDRQFDRLVVLTEEDKTYCTHCPTTTVIPNPITATSEALSSLDGKVILSVGRLDNQKNFPELIDIWALIAQDYPDWKLRIVGEGYTDVRIIKKVKEYGLEEQFELCPFTKEVQKHYLSASVYAMTSAFEGLPLVLVEAESMGLPVVSYACPCGPRDIIRDGQDGFLVEPGDKETFAARLRQLIEDEELRRRMGQAAKVNSQRFSLDNVMKQWEDLFAELTAK